jgi:hypothetical protein
MRAVPGEPIPLAVKERVIALYRQGVPTPDITAQTGVSRSSIYYIAKRAGVRPNRQKQYPKVDDTEVSPWYTSELMAAHRRIGELEAQVKMLREFLDGQR